MDLNRDRWKKRKDRAKRDILSEKKAERRGRKVGKSEWKLKRTELIHEDEDICQLLSLING